MAELQWRGALSGATSPTCRRWSPRRPTVDGTAPLSEHVLLHLRHGGDAEAAHLLARERRRAGGVRAPRPHRPGRGRRGRAGGAPRAPPGGPGHAHRAGAARPRRRRPVAAGGCGCGRTASTPARSRSPRAPGLHRRPGCCGRCAAACSPRCAEPHLPDGVRLRPFVVGRRRGRVPARQQRRLRLAPRAGRLDARRGASSARPSRGSTRRASCSPSTPTTALLGFHWTKVHAAGTGEAHSHEPDRRGLRARASTRPRAGMHLGAALTLAGLRAPARPRPARR